MTEQVEVQEATKIVIPTEKYVKCKTAAGGASHHNGDPVAVALSGALLSDVYSIAAAMLDVEVSELEDKYEHLNAGQQRMNLGNRIRGAVNKIDGATAKIEKQNAKIEEQNAKIDEANEEIKAHNAEVEESGKGNSKALKERKPLLEVPEQEQTGAEKLAEVAAPIREKIEARLAEEADAKAKAEKEAKAAEQSDESED